MSGRGTAGSASGGTAGISSSTNGSVSMSARGSSDSTCNGTASSGKKAKGAVATAATPPEASGSGIGCYKDSPPSPIPTSEDGRSMTSSNAATAGSGPSTSPSPSPATGRISATPAESAMALRSQADTPTPAVNQPQAFATSLLNLEVKVLTQALGAENQWAEQGDGRVAFCDLTIRVVAPRTGRDEEQKEKKSVDLAVPAASDAAAVQRNGDAGAATRKGTTLTEASALSNTVSEFDEDDSTREVVILEDTISSDTPFVGENCCIVWNSFEKQLSLCLMYASEEGYSASWSALVALQDKSYPPFRFDLLERCRPASERTVLAPGDSSSSLTPSTAATDRMEEVVLPYSYFIHTKYDPPLGFIEQHALSLSIIEHRHLTNPALYAEKETVLTMLSMANADLLDYLMSEETFPMLISGLQSTATPWSWSVPEPLRSLHVPEEVTTFIRKDRWIGFFQETVLPSCGNADTVADLLAKYAAMSRRIRNDIVCTLLTCDNMFSEACEALRAAPPVLPATASGGPSARHRVPSIEASSSVTSFYSDGRSSMSAVGSGAPSPMATPPATDPALAAQKAELQVLAYLRFFRELVTLSIAELGREMVGPIVGKIYQSGLLEPLSLVAERFAMPSGAAAAFVKHVADGNGGGLNGSRRSGGGGNAAPNSNNGAAVGTSSSTNYYSPAVEQELAAFLDVTVVRLNERQEEQLMNEHVRMPILADPAKYNGLVTFMLRQLVVGGTPGMAFSTGSGGACTGASATRSSFAIAPSSRRILRDSMSSSNPFVLFHVLGLHDDEGSAASERALDPESTDIRNRFHSFIITKYIAHATRGLMTPVPLPPSLGGVVNPARNIPIVQFNNASASHSGGSRPVNQDGSENGTGGTVLGVPNTGPGAVGSVPGGFSSSAPSPVLPLPQGITPALVRVLEYMVTLTSNANRELLLKTVFHHKSHIWHFIEGVCDTLCGGNGVGSRCQVGLDVLCGCVRFLKVVVMQLTVMPTEADENPLLPFPPSREPLSPQLITTICRQLTVERDTFGYFLKAYNRLGGLRRNSVFHSSFLAVLDLVGKCSARESEDSATNNLRDVRNFLFFKHLTRLPEVFASRYREALLSEVTLRLGQEATHSPNDSVSVLSSTAGSELTRSSSKLRFVDEVEAVSGGVDGTVVPSSVVSPAIMVNMANAEEKQRKRNTGLSIEQWNATANHVMGSSSQARCVTAWSLGDDHGGWGSHSSPPTNRASPPLTISITRPGSGGNGNGSSVCNSRAPADDLCKVSSLKQNGFPANGDGLLCQVSSSDAAGPTARKTETTLRPTAPKEEKPPGRPRNFASVLENPSRTAAATPGEQGSKSRSMPSATGRHTPPPSSPEEVLVIRAGHSSAPQSLERASGTASSSNENVVLPKIKKRLSAVGKRS
ncbi:hypothetical protein LSCM1_00996 [Leishmania martiniquensis]|uniref:Uncharacterized protein n=1 Tax=Leishmania martiniquensis TaxID=1580590 RepID=A0A836K867_9TRYP|nr:hypothetical protein LSCM1_00996 [Leishmania martiniquensis]